MAEWAQVRWTEARQVAALQDGDPAALPEEGVTPIAHFATLRTSRRGAEAVGFLALALPRLEAIAWAARVVDERAARATLTGMDRQALDHALRWLGEPTDDHRRAAKAAADSAGERAPERMLALAVFFSGGSISMPDLAPVLPPPEVAGKLAGAAISIAVSRADDAAAALDHALDLGERVAEQGTKALDPA